MTKPKPKPKRGRPPVPLEKRATGAWKPIKEMTKAEYRRYRADLSARQRAGLATPKPVGTCAKQPAAAVRAQTRAGDPAAAALKIRTTTYLPAGIVERIHNAAAALPNASINSLITDALEIHLTWLETHHNGGQPFSPVEKPRPEAPPRRRAKPKRPKPSPEL